MCLYALRTESATVKRHQAVWFYFCTFSAFLLMLHYPQGVALGCRLVGLSARHLLIIGLFVYLRVSIHSLSFIKTVPIIAKIGLRTNNTIQCTINATPIMIITPSLQCKKTKHKSYNNYYILNPINRKQKKVGCFYWVTLKWKKGVRKATFLLLLIYTFVILSFVLIH